MIKLTHENFIKARDYIFVNSDDINRVWFRYNFEEGDTNAFMDALAKYQHDNGGLGGIFGFRKMQIIYEASRTMGMLAKIGRFGRIDNEETKISSLRN